MRYAIVESGIVTNVLRGAAPQGAVQIPDGVYVTIGYLWDGVNFSAPSAAQLAASNEAEGLAAFNNGTLDPDKLFKLIKALGLVVADLHSVTPAQMRDAVIAKYKAL